MCVSCQLVTTIPTRRLPKKLVLGEVTHEEIKQMEKAVEEDHVDEAGQRGQYLWIRGLTRLQHQVNSLHLYDASRSKTDSRFSLLLLTLCGFRFGIFICFFFVIWTKDAL